jgi:hypothetical protein
MHVRFAPSHGQPSFSWLQCLGRLTMLLLPVSLMAVASLRAVGDRASILWLGTLFQILACFLALFASGGCRRPAGPSVIMLYVIALSWMLLGGVGADDWFTHLSQAILLVVPLLAFGMQCLQESGAPALRRARQIADRLARRHDWPASLDDCRALAEVKALRESLHVDAAPALSLLSNARPQVRIAALAAMEFRQDWRGGQPEVVLNAARRSPEPEMRAAAVLALANLEDRLLVEALAEFLHDSSPLVRQAAREAVLWDIERRWSWVRLPLRHSLADPMCEDDGPLKLEGQAFPPEAVTDLTAWAAEKGLLGMRAALTLGQHYAQILTNGSDPETIHLLRELAVSTQAPPMLRLELARLLQHHNELSDGILQQLLDPATPASLRLVAVESLLSRGPAPGAIAALHELARLPNREIALATADVVQRRLGVELGLNRDQPPPPVQSRHAAEVARRLLLWAHQNEIGDDSQPVGPRSPLDVNRRSLTEM